MKTKNFVLTHLELFLVVLEFIHQLSKEEMPNKFVSITLALKLVNEIMKLIKERGSKLKSIKK